MASVTQEPATEKNLDGYDAPLIPWSKVQATLEGNIPQAPDTGGPNRHTFWLATVRPDGRPHVMPFGGFWQDGKVYIVTGKGSRKGRNMADNPNVVVTVATHPFDLVIEGRATRVTDPTQVARLAKVAADDGWPAEARGDEVWAEFSAPSAGAPPWHVYEVVPETVFALGAAEPYGATRFRF
jgi:nitroimidazol reductase NimA-like FMN-containing flavoprotein (pyridoxamine 5'-phosphate oxidase superfamily)